MKWIMCYVIAVCIAGTVFAATVAPLPFNIFFYNPNPSVCRTICNLHKGVSVMDGTWIDHDGKPFPRHATFRDMVYVRFRDGTETQQAEHVSYFCGSGNNWKWGAPADPENEIVAYKVA